MHAGRQKCWCFLARGGFLGRVRGLFLWDAAERANAACTEDCERAYLWRIDDIGENWGTRTAAGGQARGDGWLARASRVQVRGRLGCERAELPRLNQKHSEELHQGHLLLHPRQPAYHQLDRKQVQCISCELVGMGACGETGEAVYDRAAEIVVDGRVRAGNASGELLFPA